MMESKATENKSWSKQGVKDDNAWKDVEKALNGEWRSIDDIENFDIVGRTKKCEIYKDLFGNIISHIKSCNKWTWSIGDPLSRDFLYSNGSFQFTKKQAYESMCYVLDMYHQKSRKLKRSTE